MTGIVISHRISVVKGCCVREALPHPFNMGVFKYGKNNSTTMKHIYNLRTWMKVVTLLLTAIIGGIFHKQRQWLAWGVWWHALASVTHEITWRCICSLIKPNFAPKFTQSCYNWHQLMPSKGVLRTNSSPVQGHRLSWTLIFVNRYIAILMSGSPCKVFSELFFFYQIYLI